MSSEYPSVKHLVQPIALEVGSGGRFPVQVDQAVSKWVDAGYTLVSAHPYASEHDTIHMVYVLVKYPVV